MSLRKPDTRFSLPTGWVRADEQDDLETPVTLLPPEQAAGALQLSMPMLAIADDPAEQIEMMCRTLGLGVPCDLALFEARLGPAAFAQTPDGPVDCVWCFHPQGCPFVLATWTGEARFLPDAERILQTMTAGPLMGVELALLRAVINMTSELALGEDIIPHASILAGPVHHHFVLAGAPEDLPRIVAELRRDVQSRRAEIVSVCGEYRRRYPNGETDDVVVLYIESRDGSRQYEFPTDASVAPRRIGPIDIVPPSGWGPFVDLLRTS